MLVLNFEVILDGSGSLQQSCEIDSDEEAHTRCRVSGFGGFGRVWGLGFWVSGFGFAVCGLRLRVKG